MKIKQHPTQAELKQLFNYNPDTGIFTCRTRVSNKVKLGNIVGSHRSDGYIYISVNSTRYLAHRLAWIYMNGEIPINMQVDHINGVKNDTRLINLRLATHSQNLCNQTLSPKNTSGFKGVHWCKTCKKWIARVKLNGKKHQIGRFVEPDKAAAIAAVMQAREAMHGEFTNHGEIHLARPIPTPTLF